MMTRTLIDPGREVYEKQAIVTLDQTAPGDGTYYIVLNVKAPIRLIYASMKHANTGASAANMTMRVTIDGVVMSATQTSAASGTVEYFYADPTADAGILTTTVYNAGYYEDLRGNSLEVEIMMPTGSAAGEHVYGYVQYEILRRG